MKQETKDKISKALKGKPKSEKHKANLSKSSWIKGKAKENHPFYGKHHTEESNLKNRDAHLNKPSWNKGKPHSEEHRKNLSIATTGKKGELCSHWKGGLTPLVLLIRHSPEYEMWRSNVFNRDDFTCKHCGKSGGYLEAHHILPFSNIMYIYKITDYDKAMNCNTLWDIENGITLCEDCHEGVPI